MDGEPAGANEAERSGRVPDGYVSTGSPSVDEGNDSGAKREFGIVDVVDEHVVPCSQRVPLELQHHAARSSAPSKTWSHGLQSHHSGVRVGSRVGSLGNIWRQRQHRRSGTPIEGPSGPTGLSERTGAPSWPSWRRSGPSATCRSRSWFGESSLAMAPLSWDRCAAGGRGDAAFAARRPRMSQSSSRNRSACCDMSNPFGCPRAAGKCVGPAGCLHRTPVWTTLANYF